MRKKIDWSIFLTRKTVRKLGNFLFSNQSPRPIGLAGQMKMSPKNFDAQAQF